MPTLGLGTVVPTKRSGCLALCLALCLVASPVAAQTVPPFDYRQAMKGLFVAVDAAGCPIERAAASFDDLLRLCGNYEREASRARGSERQRWGELARMCFAGYASAYGQYLESRFAYADFAAVAQAATSTPGSDLECLLATSHNQRLESHIQRQQGAIDAEAARINRDSARTDAAIAALRAPATEPDAPKPSVAQTIGLVLNGVGQGLTTHSPGGHAPPPAAGRGSSAPTPAGCMSDYACGPGFVCVKPNFSAAGQCKRAVDSLGVPQPTRMADPSSVQVKVPGRADCRFDVQCPVGFRCDQASGACVK